jgi:hypothetical protein
MTTDAPPLLRELAGALLKTTLVVLALALVYPYLAGTLARALTAH